MIRYSKLGAFAPYFGDYLRQIMGYSAAQDDTGWYVPSDDPVLSDGPPDFIRLHKEVLLSGRDRAAIAEELVSFVPHVGEEHLKEARALFPSDIPIAGGLGQLTEASRVATELTFAHPRELSDVLSQSVIPFLSEQLGATHVAAIFVDANELQKHISFHKIPLLNEWRGKAGTEEFIQGRGQGLTQLLLDPFTVASFPGVFTLVTPLAITLPMMRHCCAFHFYRDGGWFFRHPSNEGMFSLFTQMVDPVVGEADLLLYGKKSAFAEVDLWSYLRLVVTLIDRLLKFLVDPRNFVDESSEVDLLRQIQSIGAANLVFADLQRLGLSTDNHDQTTYSFGVIDKLANLRTQLGNHPKKDEHSIARTLPSLDQASELQSIFRDEVFGYWPVHYERLVSAMSAFDETHEELRQELGAMGEQEAARLNLLRAHRNMRHGTLLSREQFEELFLAANGRVPTRLRSIAILLTLGMMADPARFMRFRPKV